MMKLTRVVPWCHTLIMEVLSKGDLAIDLTAGRGRDTLALAHAVGATGTVVAFDLQPEAIRQTAELLADHGLRCHLWTAETPIPNQPGIYLVSACHASLRRIIGRAPKAVIANLGYLPGGDRALVTRPETTVAALQQALERLHPAGRIGVVVYPSHPGGAEEFAAVRSLLGGLPQQHWDVLHLQIANRPEAPHLLIVESRRRCSTT